MTQLAAETNHSKRYTAHPVPQQGADKDNKTNWFSRDGAILPTVH